MHTLQESFYSSPFENKTVVKTDGQIAGYTSKELKSELINGISKNNLLSSSVKTKLSETIQKKRIVPVYLHNMWALDITQQFFQIFREYTNEECIMGFYNGNGIFLMASNLRAINGDISPVQMYDIIAHEHQHLFAGERPAYTNDPNIKNILNTWYSEFIDDYYGDIEPAFRKKLMNYFCNIKWESNKGIKSDSKWNSRLKEFNSLTDNIDLSENSLSKHENLIRYVKNAINGDIEHDNFNPYLAGKAAYGKLGIRPNTFIYQEFYVASEVLSVCSGNDTKIGNYFLNKYL